MDVGDDEVWSKGLERCKRSLPILRAPDFEAVPIQYLSRDRPNDRIVIDDEDMVLWIQTDPICAPSWE